MNNRIPWWMSAEIARICSGTPKTKEEALAILEGIWESVDVEKHPEWLITPRVQDGYNLNGNYGQKIVGPVPEALIRFNEWMCQSHGRMINVDDVDADENHAEFIEDEDMIYLLMNGILRLEHKYHSNTPSCDGEDDWGDVIIDKEMIDKLVAARDQIVSPTRHNARFTFKVLSYYEHENPSEGQQGKMFGFAYEQMLADGGQTIDEIQKILDNRPGPDFKNFHSIAF